MKKFPRGIGSLFVVCSLSGATLPISIMAPNSAHAVAQELTPAATTAATTAAATSTIQAPNTDNCPQALTPPPAVDTSEALAPGAPTPTALAPAADTFCGVQSPAGFVVDSAVVAAAWMVTDLDSGAIVAMKDPHGRYRPASIIKALLALVAINELDLQQKIIATHDDAAAEGSAVGIGEGGQYTVEQLLQGLLLGSGNDAAHTLATALGGDDVTLRKVNDLARSLGTTDTYAASYSGLDGPGMSTSAYDISLIYTAAFHNPTFARIVSTEKVTFPGYKDNPSYELWNDNGLFMNTPDGIGGKTGFTDDAHHTFVGAQDRAGHRLMAVILDTTVENGFRAWQQSQKLLDQAYLTNGNVGQLVALRAQSTSSSPEVGASSQTAPAATPEPFAAPSSPSNQWRQRGLGWAVLALVVLIAVLVGAFSLLRPGRRGRGRHAAGSRG